MELTGNGNVQVVQPAGESNAIDLQDSNYSSSLPSYSLTHVQTQIHQTLIPISK